MPKFDEFDLDLRQPESNGVANVAAGATDADAIASLTNCTKNGRGFSMVCSLCCTSITTPAGCSTTC